jgi:phospholipid/cholesterol/gamma-HCH transport system permease protein
VSVFKDLWESLSESLVNLGEIVHFLLRLIANVPRSLLRFDLVVEQIYNPAPVAGHHHVVGTVRRHGSRPAGVPAAAALRFRGSPRHRGGDRLVKELGPVITALLFAGRAGTALASEIGLMRATDQLSAMEMMAVDPIQRVVVPRFLGGVIAMPLLAAIFSMIGIFGAQLIGVQVMGVDSGSFWSQMRASVDFVDITEGIVKSLIFGVACSLIAVYEGYYSVPTAEGVGTATTRTVVLSAVMTLFLDYLITAMFL